MEKSKRKCNNESRSEKNITREYIIRLLICTPIIIAMTIMELIFSNVTTKENSNPNKEIEISEDVTTSDVQSVAEVEPNVVNVKYSQYTLPAEEETENVEELTEQAPLEWFLENDSTDKISIWKKTAEDGLLVQIRNEKEEVLSTFLLESDGNKYSQWVECSTELSLSTSDLLDATFLAYREVGGKNSLNVQAQIAVLINRVNYANSYGESIREVINRPGQYGSCYNIINRRPKSSTNIEREDLKKTLYQTILYFADEKLPEIEAIPTNVVYAALGRQGSGTWMVIDGTMYCYR